MTTDHPTLVVIDVQQAFDDPGWGPRNNPEAEHQVAALLAAWRRVDSPIVHVRHRGTHPASPFQGQGFEFKPEALPAPGEPIIEKGVHSAFIGTELERRLRDASVEHVVVAGLTSDHCCSTTARMAADLGFRVTLASDATATFDRVSPTRRRFTAEEMHESALTSLSGEFAEIRSTASIIERLMGAD